ncbi:hypothetical protein OG887_06820 [Streptomyces sp. NBC_00053]|nr:hypothetical protein [Streptomyces sp. NBC_00052]MCX5552364.1 hypothetical protein [Streptomyces sp. NBC_00051]WSP50387.1 hypothetical protein OG348_33520 [Streptomyces sp. NBC_01243]
MCDRLSPHLTTKRCRRAGSRAAVRNVEIDHTSANSSWLNRIKSRSAAT